MLIIAVLGRLKLEDGTFEVSLSYTVDFRLLGIFFSETLFQNINIRTSVFSVEPKSYFSICWPLNEKIQMMNITLSMNNSVSVKKVCLDLWKVYMYRSGI